VDEAHAANMRLCTTCRGEDDSGVSPADIKSCVMTFGFLFNVVEFSHLLMSMHKIGGSNWTLVLDKQWRRFQPLSTKPVTPMQTTTSTRLRPTEEVLKFFADVIKYFRNTAGILGTTWALSKHGSDSPSALFQPYIRAGRKVSALILATAIHHHMFGTLKNHARRSAHATNFKSTKILDEVVQYYGSVKSANWS
jgi:hypothetical protein